MSASIACDCTVEVAQDHDAPTFVLHYELSIVFLGPFSKHEELKYCHRVVSVWSTVRTKETNITLRIKGRVL